MTGIFCFSFYYLYSHEKNITPPLFIEMSVPSQERERSRVIHI